MINIEQSLLRDVGVNLGGRQISVSEKLLHAAEIGSSVKQMGGETVTQCVRARGFHKPRSQ